MRTVECFILSYLLNSLWQVPLLLAAGWLAARILRPAGAAIEHRVWVTTLLLQITVPASFFLPGEWLRPWLFWSVPGKPAGAHVSVVLAGGAGVASWEWPGPWLTVLTILYAAGLCWYAARFLWRALRVRSLRQEAVGLELTGRAGQSWLQCCRRFGIDRASLVASPRIAGPMTMGLRHKLVLLPEAFAETVSADDLHAVIAHECAHMRRNDFAKNLVYELLSLPVAYHPLLRRTRERIMETREMVCDQMAAGLTGRKEYAHSLLRLAALVAQAMPARTPHTIGIFDAHAFERRLMSLNRKYTQSGALRRMAAFTACVALALGACGVAVALSMHVDQGPAGASSEGAKRHAALSVSADKMAGNLINKAVPQYPPDAKKAGIQGKVVLDAVIGKDGTIENLRVVSGPKELQQSSLDAVRQWTYKPYRLKGKAVEVQTTVSIIYSLAG